MVVLLTLLIAIAGTFGVTRLQSELIPNTKIPVITTYSAAEPESVDEHVSQPISKALSGVSGRLSM